MILNASELYYFLVGAGGECNEMGGGQCWPQRSAAEAAVPFGASHRHVILEKVNKRWATAGLQKNRVHTRSNTLLLWAAKETERSQSVHESTVDFFPWNLSRQQEANPPAPAFWFLFFIWRVILFLFLALIFYFPYMVGHHPMWSCRFIFQW